MDTAGRTTSTGESFSARAIDGQGEGIGDCALFAFAYNRNYTRRPGVCGRSKWAWPVGRWLMKQKQRGWYRYQCWLNGEEESVANFNMVARAQSKGYRELGGSIDSRALPCDERFESLAKIVADRRGAAPRPAAPPCRSITDLRWLIRILYSYHSTYAPRLPCSCVIETCSAFPDEQTLDDAQRMRDSCTTEYFDNTAQIMLDKAQTITSQGQSTP
nr:hypothetical protein CFP56_64740 [Quercus suber]